jgi:hypothetical protein
VARNSPELARRPTVDPHDEPSVEWGWHGSFPHGKRIAGILSMVFLLLMWFLNPHPMSFTEIVWVGGAAAVILALLVKDVVGTRHSWRR